MQGSGSSAVNAQIMEMFVVWHSATERLLRAIVTPAPMR
jgi:hypothetical protein